jgi:histidinol-phosphatase (PHP family)
MRFSYHVHSLWSDGKDSIQEIVSYAEKLGLDEIGISDHYSVAKYDPVSLPKEALDEYVEDVLQNRKANIPVRLGIEADFSLETIREMKSLLSVRPFDYVLGSVHGIDGIMIDTPGVERKLLDVEAYVTKYWILVKKMAESQVFDIVAHLDLPKKYGLKVPKKITLEMEEALIAIRDAGMSVELNTSGWFYPAQEQYPAEFLLRRCQELDISVLVSADAHSKENLTRNFDKAYQILKDLQFTKLATYKDRKKLLVDFPS